MGIIARIKGEEPGFFERIKHTYQGKGHYGEYLTEYALEHGKLGTNAVFSNVIVPRMSGPTSTSEIDVVMLHEKGVFVFESKNYSGWIFGSADQRNWTVTLIAKSKYQFYNPIKQNRAHVKALSSYLGIKEDTFKSYIVFSERCELKKVPPSTTEYVICHRQHLLSYLRHDLDRYSPVFDEATLERLKASLGALAEGSTQTARFQHLEETEKVMSSNTCPWCGSELVERNGKYGPFMGCSSYPRCHFTRKIQA